MKNKLVMRQFSYRFVVVLLFALAAIFSVMNAFLVSPIIYELKNAYNVSYQLVLLLPLSFNIMYILMNFFSTWVIDVKGSKKSVVTGCILMCIGSSIRCLVGYNFGFAVFGQFISATGQPFILNSISALTVRWFRPQTRNYALSFCSWSIMVGHAAGFIIPAFFISQQTESSKTIKEFLTLNILYAVLSCTITILIMLFFRSNPSIPPSLAAIAENMPFKQSVRKLYRSGKFMIIVFGFGCTIGGFIGFEILAIQLLSPYGYSPIRIQSLIGCLIGFGLVSSMVISFFVRNSKNYECMFKILGLIGCVLPATFILSLIFAADQFWIFLIIFSAKGALIMPLIPLTIDYVCEIWFPIGEGQLVGALITIANLIGGIQVVFNKIVFNLNKENKKGAFEASILIGASITFGFITYILFKNQLTRSLFQRQANSIHDLEEIQLIKNK